MRPRKQTYTMDMYLSKIKDMDIRNDSDTQRQFVWSNEQINELILTVLTDDYIPPIILAEVDDSQLWIVDGGQRSSSFNKFRYGNYKITSAIENSIVPYKKKIKGEDGKIRWEDAEYDIKNKTYDKLPEELKKKFNEYQIETAIHEDCDTHRIAQLIKRYNNHTSMNGNQKAFTYADRYAREVRDILGSRFFLDCGSYTEKERNKGVLERVILESVMCIFHFDQWKKQPKQIAKHINENSSSEEFVKLQSIIDRLECIVSEDIKDMFTSKDTFIWLKIFNEFTKIGFADDIFANFLREFKLRLKDETINGTSFTELNENRGTKDKVVIASKIKLLMELLLKYLEIDKSYYDEGLINFVSNCVESEFDSQDIELYETIAKDISGGRLSKISCKNKPSVIAAVAYSCINDINIENLFDEMIDKTNFVGNQKENYLYMKEFLDKRKDD